MINIRIACFLVVLVAAISAQPHLDCLKPLGGAENLLGKKVIENGRGSDTFDLEAPEILQSTLPGNHRIVHPREGMTMDWVPSRLNLMVDDSNTVIRAHCG